MNSFSAVGRIGRDAEVRYTQSGTALTVFPLAVDDGIGDKKVTTWIDCAMWGERGTKIAEHIRKETARARDLITRFNIKPE